MPVKAKVPACEPISVGAKLRRTHPWFDAAAQRSKEAAIRDRRKKERAKGPPLSSEELVGLADELERIQQELNPLEIRRKEIVDVLLPHWGHTGIKEIESALGRTLISTSFELCVDPETVRKTVDDTLWHKLTARVLQAQNLLSEGKTAARVREAASNALLVKKLKVSITSPSSRRPRSGETGDTEEDAAA